MKKKKKKQNKVKKTIRSGAFVFAPSSIDYKDYIVDVKFTDKKKYSITLNMLEKLLEESIRMNKKSLLKIGIKRNDKEIFVLECKIRLERK